MQPRNTVARNATAALFCFTALALSGWVPLPAALAQTPPAAASKPSKSCIAARSKLDREQKSLAQAEGEIERYTRLREGCTAKSVCARYAASLDSLDKRVARHHRRIDRFTAARDEACKPGAG